MSGASNYLESELVDHVLGTGSWAAPSSVYVKLHTGDPGEEAIANTAMASAASEADRRELVTFDAAIGGVATNTGAVTFSNIPDTETYSHFSLWDSDTAGNALVYGALTASKAMTAGDNFVIPAGQLSVTAL